MLPTPLTSLAMTPQRRSRDRHPAEPRCASVRTNSSSSRRRRARVRGATMRVGFVSRRTASANHKCPGTIVRRSTVMRAERTRPCRRSGPCGRGRRRRHPAPTGMVAATPDGRAARGTRAGRRRDRRRPGEPATAPTAMGPCGGQSDARRRPRLGHHDHGDRTRGRTRAEPGVDWPTDLRDRRSRRRRMERSGERARRVRCRRAPPRGRASAASVRPG